MSYFHFFLQNFIFCPTFIFHQSTYFCLKFIPPLCLIFSVLTSFLHLSIICLCSRHCFTLPSFFLFYLFFFLGSFSSRAAFFFLLSFFCASILLSLQVQALFGRLCVQAVASCVLKVSVVLFYFFQI